MYKRQGWLSYDWIPEDAYLQLTGCSVAHGINEALSELLDRLEAQFAGYTAYFGFPDENREALHFLSARGFTCIEQDWNHSFFFADYVPYPDNAQVERITHQNFEKFRAVYHADAETYWNCDRIYASLDKCGRFLCIIEAISLLQRSFSQAAMDIMKSTARNLPRTHSKLTYFKRW